MAVCAAKERRQTARRTIRAVERTISEVIAEEVGGAGKAPCAEVMLMVGRDVGEFQRHDGAILDKMLMHAYSRSARERKIAFE